MDGDTKFVHKLVRGFDRNMYAKRTGDGIIRVYCNADSHKVIDLGNGQVMVYSIKEPYHVFSLTDTWGYWGKSRNYGSMPIWEKLRQISFENRDRLIKGLEECERLAEEKRKRDLANTTESMAYEAREVFKEATRDVVFNTIDKSKDPRRKQDKKIKEI